MIDVLYYVYNYFLGYMHTFNDGAESHRAETPGAQSAPARFKTLPRLTFPFIILNTILFVTI